MPFGREIGLGPGDIVLLNGDPAPLPEKGAQHPPLFGPCLLWPNGSMDQDTTWYGSGPWPRPHCVRWGPSSPCQKRGKPPPQFSAHVRCGQMAGWINMPLGTEVGLGADDSALDGTQLPLKRCTAPHFSSHDYCGQTVAHLSYCWTLVIELQLVTDRQTDGWTDTEPQQIPH